MVEHGLCQQLEGLGWTVKLHSYEREFDAVRSEYETSDAPFGIVKRPRYVGRVNKMLCGHLSRFHQSGNLALTIGGDHSLAIGTIGATAEKFGEDYCVVWVDAHADINTPETTETGNLHGCPLSFLLGLSATQLPGFEWVKKSLRKDRLVYIGLRVRLLFHQVSIKYRSLLNAYLGRGLGRKEVAEEARDQGVFHARGRQVWYWKGRGNGTGPREPVSPAAHTSEL